jgi:23S rRNA (guanosine2251-2'-O)-methyltransferase
MPRHRRQNRRREGGSTPSRPHTGSDAARSSDRELIYGRQPVRELLRAGRRRIAGLYVLSSAKSTADLEEIVSAAEERNVQLHHVGSERLVGMVGDVNHQGVVVDVYPFRYVSYKKMLSDAGQVENPLFLFLDHLEDPQNVGSLLRSAEAAGVTGVVIPAHRAVAITPAVVRASAGAAEHMSVAIVPNIVRCMKLLKDRGVWFAGLEAVEEATLISDTDLTGPLGVVVGSEGKGMRRLTRETCDYLVKLPMSGKVSSLNAGVAGAIALFEVLRQRGAAGD